MYVPLTSVDWQSNVTFSTYKIMSIHSLSYVPLSNLLAKSFVTSPSSCVVWQICVPASSVPDRSKSYATFRSVTWQSYVPCSKLLTQVVSLPPYVSMKHTISQYSSQTFQCWGTEVFYNDFCMKIQSCKNKMYSPDPHYLAVWGICGKPNSSTGTSCNKKIVFFNHACTIYISSPVQ